MDMYETMNVGFVFTIHSSHSNDFVMRFHGLPIVFVDETKVEQEIEFGKVCL